MLRIEIPSDKELIRRQIKALKFIIGKDKQANNKVDLEIHQQALNDLEKVLNKLD